MSCFPPNAELLRIEKIRRVDLVKGNVSRGVTFTRTSFAMPLGIFTLLFSLLLLPGLPYHKVLYDTL